jgi:hypothetical protein
MQPQPACPNRGRCFLGIEKRREPIVERRDASIEYFIRDLVEAQNFSAQRNDLRVIAGARHRGRGAFQRCANSGRASRREE